METSTPSSTSHLLVFARLSGLLVQGLSFRSNFLSHNSSTHDAHMYSVLHVLVMVLGFVLISGEAWCLNSFQGQEIGIFNWTKFHLERGVLANLYTFTFLDGFDLHLLVCCSGQHVCFWHQGQEPSTRVRVLPFHVFLGLYVFGLAIATAVLGLIEKFTFLEAKTQVMKHSLESVVVNSLRLGLAFRSGIDQSLSGVGGGQ
ncbi:hypothetical protein MKW94_011146 [Papaver nudicaule]|uniref:Cytochrome b561 domain-containing protein n=1 Tax=Papaver nudicaule TaxID=74823 RepID=A0AA41V3R6_PAPNU|nr:hypothetical protein [Papaver nudicaule]